MSVQFDHAFTIAFSLRSATQKGDDVTPAMLSAALRKRADELDDSFDRADRGGEWLEACFPPYDTYEVEP